MSHEQAFLHAIQANPEDDTPRLVFADWLDEHGDPERAEFIRVQVELARTPWPARRWFTLQHRQDELLTTNRQPLNLHGEGSSVGDAGAIALARSRRLPRLESLELRANEITDEGALAFLKPAHLPRVRELNLQDNPEISEETLARLQQRYSMPTM